MPWNPLDEPVDFVILGGKRTPGIAEIVDAANLYDWDERRGYGFSGATSVYRGQRLSPAKIIIRLYTAQDWDDWDEFRTILAPPQPNPRALSTAAIIASQRPRALEIVHPIAEMMGIRTVTIENVKQPTQTGDGEWTIEIAIKSWQRPQFAAARPEGAKDRPLDETEQLISDMGEMVANGGEGPSLQALAPRIGNLLR